MYTVIQIPYVRIMLIGLIYLATTACKEITPIAPTDQLVTLSTVFIGTADRTFYALDALTGLPHWQTTTSEVIMSSPVVSQTTVYALSDHQVYSINAETGEVNWTFSSPDNTLNTRSTLMVRQGNVYFVGGNGRQFYALDAQTGAQKWRVVIPTSDLVYGIPTAVDQTVYVGSSDNHLYAIDAQTGRTQQVFKVGAGQEGIYGAPLVANGKLYVGSYDGNLYALDAATGRPQWVSRLGGWLTYVGLSGQTLYVNSWQEIFALDVRTGTLAWRFKPAISGTTGARSLQAGVLYGSYSLLDSPQLSLYALNASTGAKQWEQRTWPGASNELAYGVVAANGLLYVAGADHQLYALDAASGETKWTFPTRSGITSSPCVVNKEGVFK